MNQKLNSSRVYFDRLTHTYLRESDNKVLKGVTGTLIKRAFPDTYADVPEDVLRHAAERGTAVHDAIDRYIEGDEVGMLFLDVTAKAQELLTQRKLTPIATEYIVTDGENYASPIDILCTDDNGKYCIIDIKTTSQKMYEHVQLQLSIYRRFFMMQNQGLEVGRLFCMWLPVDDDFNVKDSDMFEVSVVNDEYLDYLIQCDINDELFSVEKFYGNLPARLHDVEAYMRDLDTMLREKKAEYDSIKEGLLKMMAENNVKSFDSGRTRLTRVLSQKKKSFDTDRFKKEHPDIYEMYSTKITNTKESIKITFK